MMKNRQPAGAPAAYCSWAATGAKDREVDGQFSPVAIRSPADAKGKCPPGTGFAACT
jgi:hypothetical protein